MKKLRYIKNNLSFSIFKNINNQRLNNSFLAQGLLGKRIFLKWIGEKPLSEFFIYTEKGNMILLEIKGDDWDNDDNRIRTDWEKPGQKEVGMNINTFSFFRVKKNRKYL